jgi:adenylate cyclase
MKRFLKRLFSLNPISLTLSSILLVAVLFLIGIPFLELVELKTIDFRFRSRGQVQPSPQIVLAAIDEKSVRSEGRWPWPRSKIATLVDRLSRDGAKVIGFDIGFLEPDQNTNLKFLNQFDQKVRDLQVENKDLFRFIRETKVRADNDLALASAFADSSAAVILGYFFHIGNTTEDQSLDQNAMARQQERIKASRYGLTIYEDEAAKSFSFITAALPQANLDAFAKTTEGAGYFNMLPDPDGVIRWMPLIIQCGQDTYPPLSVACAWHYLNRPQLMVKVASYGVAGIQMGKRFIPTDEHGRLLINYLGPEKTFTHYSISDILAGRLPKGTFKDRIVLVGATATGIYDVRNTPFSSLSIYPGLEIHATLIDNILKSDFLSKPQWASVFDLLAIAVIGLLMGLVLPHLRATWGILFATGLFILHIILSRWLFVSSGILINMVYPLLALLICYTSLTVFHYFTEERERKKIKGAFSYYVSSSVVNEMLKDPERLKLGGEKKDLSVLFSDIRGFTTISESLPPEELVHLLNEYLTVMTDVVFKYDGTLDKYMGDAIMAIYGAPLDQEDHPSRACLSALEMMEALERLNQKWIGEGKPPVDIGIGINTGMMMVGNMGSDQRFDYTVMGDEVNLGSRLEGANKNYRTNILLSQFTYERVKDQFVCMEVDRVRVKGKQLPVNIYQLHGHDRVPEARQNAIVRFDQGLQLYRQQKWDEAVKIFSSVSELDPGLYAADLYIRRCQELKSHPPSPDWDGVFTMTTK